MIEKGMEEGVFCKMDLYVVLKFVWVSLYGLINLMVCLEDFLLGMLGLEYVICEEVIDFYIDVIIWGLCFSV